MTKKIHLNQALLWFSIFLVVLGWYHPLFLVFKTDIPAQYVIYSHLFSDDTFYYLEIGRNIIESATSSFDGITLTNGYQPLWMLLITLLGYFLPVDSLAYAITLLCIIAIFITIGTYSFHCLQKKYFSTVTNYYAAVSYAFSALFISRLGMETCLIFLFFPLFIQACIRCLSIKTPCEAFLAGILSSLLILSRLDSFLLVGLILGVIIIYSMFIKKSNFPTQFIFTFISGLLPIVIYLAINRFIFGQFFPISGIAKSLHSNSFIFSQRGLLSVLKTILHEKYLLIFFVVSLVSLPIIFSRFVKEKRIIDLLIIAISLFPFIFFGFYFLMSDWPLWLWYFYPLSLSFSFSMLFMEEIFFNRIIPGKLTNYLLIITTIGLFIFVLQNYVAHVNEKFTPGPLLTVALKIRDFAATHPGIYAMGDRAGIVSFMLDDPLIQLEGLVSDESMINNISSQKNLRDVLLNYGVDYYIASSPPQVDSCVSITEPTQPGPFAPRMMAQLCDQPVFSDNEKGYVTIYKISSTNQ